MKSQNNAQKNDTVISMARPLLNKHSSLKMNEKCNSSHMSDLDLAPPYWNTDTGPSFWRARQNF